MPLNTAYKYSCLHVSYTMMLSAYEISRYCTVSNRCVHSSAAKTNWTKTRNKRNKKKSHIASPCHLCCRSLVNFVAAGRTEDCSRAQWRNNHMKYQLVAALRSSTTVCCTHRHLRMNRWCQPSCEGPRRGKRELVLVLTTIHINRMLLVRYKWYPPLQ